jgi:predicted nucleic acid-binding protein
VVTSDYVLDELITRLFRRRPFPGAAEFVEGILLSVARGHYILAPVNELRFARALHLRRKFSDKPRISFTDLTSMAIMQELRVLDVLTADENFLQAGMGFRIHPD